MSSLANEDKAAWRRSEGKSLTQASILWTITVQGAQARCLPTPTGYKVQFREEKGWRDADGLTGSKASDLFVKVAGGMARMLKKEGL